MIAQLIWLELVDAERIAKSTDQLIWSWTAAGDHMGWTSCFQSPCVRSGPQHSLFCWRVLASFVRLVITDYLHLFQIATSRSGPTLLTSLVKSLNSLDRPPTLDWRPRHFVRSTCGGLCSTAQLWSANAAPKNQEPGGFTADNEVKNGKTLFDPNTLERLFRIRVWNGTSLSVQMDRKILHVLSGCWNCRKRSCKKSHNTVGYLAGLTDLLAKPLGTLLCEGQTKSPFTLPIHTRT